MTAGCLPKIFDVYFEIFLNSVSKKIKKFSSNFSCTDFTFPNKNNLSDINNYVHCCITLRKGAFTKKH